METTASLDTFHRGVEQQEKQKLTYFADTSNNKKHDQEDDKLFINLSVAQILLNISSTVINIINDITNGHIKDFQSLARIFFVADRAIYVGIILLFIAFSIYIIDITS
jgi:hypothetical protein